MGLETLDNVVNEIGHISERFVNRLTFNNLRLSERYDKGELGCIVHFTIGESAEEFAAYFQLVETQFDENLRGSQIGMPNPLLKSGLTAKEFVLHLLKDTAKVHIGFFDQANNAAVLLNVVKLVEQPKTVIPTFVWFERVNRFYRRIGRALYFAKSVGFVIRGAVVNRERDMRKRVFLIGRDANAFCSDMDQLIGEMVQRASQVTKSVGNELVYRDRNGLDAFQIIDRLTRLRIALGPDFIRLGVVEPSKPSLQVTEVLFGPFGFYPDSFEPLVSRCH